MFYPKISAATLTPVSFASEMRPIWVWSTRVPTSFFFWRDGRSTATDVREDCFLLFEGECSLWCRCRCVILKNCLVITF